MDVHHSLALYCYFICLVGHHRPCVAGMPTVPFLIVALWAASKGWPQLETWLLNHPKYGPDLIAWREHRQIRRRNKIIAILMMASGYLISWFIPLPMWLRITVGSILLVVAVWLACLDEYKESKEHV